MASLKRSAGADFVYNNAAVENDKQKLWVLNFVLVSCVSKAVNTVTESQPRLLRLSRRAAAIDRCAHD